MCNNCGRERRNQVIKLKTGSNNLTESIHPKNSTGANRENGDEGDFSVTSSSKPYASVV
jgi:hypothetical protein